MRRFVAAGIDFVISYILSVIVYFTLISGWKMIRSIQGPDMGSYNKFMVILLFFVAFILTNMLYSLFFDLLFQGQTLGKKISVCNINVGPKSSWEGITWIVKHALLRSLASLFYIITAIYYIITLKMPYDKNLGVFIETEEIIISRTTNAKKRLIAAIIDLLISLFVYTLLMFVFSFCFRNRSDLLLNITGTSIIFIWTYLFSYFFIIDYFYKGNSIGKKKMRIRLLADQKEFSIRTSLLHSVLKTLACCIWPLSLIFYISKGVMFYDQWIKLKVIESFSY